MVHKKTDLQRIANESRRRAVFNIRCEHLFKKASELSTLCGVKVCVVVYGENEAQLKVWPSIPEATDMLTRYKTMPKCEQRKRETTYEEYLRYRITKLKEYVIKQKQENRELETFTLLVEYMAGRCPDLAGISNEKLIDLREMVQRMMKKVKERMEQLGVPDLETPL